MSLLEAEEVAEARSPFSTSRTERPRPAASRAIPTPLMPPPTTSMSRIWAPGKSDPSANTETPTREPRPLPAACRAGALDEFRQEGNVVAGDRVDEALGDPFLKTGDDVAPALPIRRESLRSRQVEPVGNPCIVQRLSIMRVEHVELDRQGSGAARPQHTKNVGVAGVGDGLGLDPRVCSTARFRTIWSKPMTRTRSKAPVASSNAAT